jgi:hypothetical protein
VIHENRERRDCTVCERANLAKPAAGPLLVLDETATLYVPPGWRAVNDDAGNLIMKRIQE